MSLIPFDSFTLLFFKLVIPNPSKSPEGKWKLYKKIPRDTFPWVDNILTIKVPLSKALNPAGVNVFSGWERSGDNKRLGLLVLGSSQWPKLVKCGFTGQLPGMNVHYCKKKCKAGHFWRSMCMLSRSKILSWVNECISQEKKLPTTAIWSVNELSRHQLKLHLADIQCRWIFVEKQWKVRGASDGLRYSNSGSIRAWLDPLGEKGDTHAGLLLPVSTLTTACSLYFVEHTGWSMAKKRMESRVGGGELGRTEKVYGKISRDQ